MSMFVPAFVIGGIGGLIASLVQLAIAVAVIAGCWKMFVKAGKPGWACIVPIYNAMVIAEICGKPSWWGLLCLIPFVGFIVAILLMLELAKAFGKSTGFAVGLILLGFIFIPILGFGDAKYVGPQSSGAGARAAA
jgi:hypothetical protein